MMAFGRVLRTGLSSLRDRAGARLAALRFNPSRYVRNLIIFPLARRRLVCTLLGHQPSVRVAVFNLQRGSGWAKECPRCHTLEEGPWAPL
jgi:hypothetical protein